MCLCLLHLILDEAPKHRERLTEMMVELDIESAQGFVGEVEKIVTQLQIEDLDSPS